MTAFSSEISVFDFFFFFFTFTARKFARMHLRMQRSFLSHYLILFYPGSFVLLQLSFLLGVGPRAAGRQEQFGDFLLRFVPYHGTTCLR